MQIQNLRSKTDCFSLAMKGVSSEMEGFSQLLSKAVDDTMRRVLGESASELIYRLAEMHVALKREEVGEKIEVFYAFLEGLLGSERAQILQNTSLKRLCLKLRREYEEIEKYFWFLDELYEIKFKLLAPSFKEKERSVCD
jgi:hypothetical protein